MRSYCPVTNVKAQDYPAILALAGLNGKRTPTLQLCLTFKCSRL